MPGDTPRQKPRDIVVIGGSAGAMASLVRVTSAFPKDYSAIVLVALQRPAGRQRRVESIADFRSPLPADYASNGETLQPARVYIAPPNQLMRISASGAVVLEADPGGSRSDTAVDHLFTSAAKVYGKRVVGVVLSGLGIDGTKGLRAINAAGGLGIVQSLADASQPGMPTSAILGDHPDHIAMLDDIPKAILHVTR